jgi:hypothetical protein
MIQQWTQRGMDPAKDSTRFLEGLVSLAIMFSAQLSEKHQLDYWDVLQDEMTIDEWDTVVKQVKKQHHFRTVPLPAELIAYAKEARRPKNMPYMG